ncbi:hypothetical protein MKX03_037552, partial [Papaver bracteatum]
MAFMSPLGLGAQIIVRWRRRRPRSSKVVKSKPLGQKRKQELEVEIQEKKSRDRNRKNSRSTWTEVSIQLPYTLGGARCRFACDPVPGTDQMILTSYVKASGGKISESSCHSYNWKKKTFNAIDFSGISSAPCFSSASTVGSFFESLFPVQKR